MSVLSMLAAAGVWPAVPVTGYVLFARRRRSDAEPLPAATSISLTTVAGLAVWSVPLLASAAAGVYRPTSLGLIGWAVALIGIGVMWKDGASLLARNDGAVFPRPAAAKIDAPVQTLRKGGGRRGSRQGAQGASTRKRDDGRDTARARERESHRAWDWALAAGLILAAGLYLGFPTESIYGGRDEGVYASHAVYLAHHGRLDVPYPWPEDLHQMFAPMWEGFPGFYQTQPTMTVQFGHLFPAWMAQAFATLGQFGLFRLNAVFALLSLGVFYGVCRMVLDTPYAVVATLFLAFNPSELWMARITLSEIFTQLYTWSGLLVLLQALRYNRKPAAYWAGVFFGVSALVRFDSMLLLPVLFLIHAAVKIVEEPTGKSTPIWRALYLTALPTFALALGYYAVFSRPYFVGRPYLWQLEVACIVAPLVLLAPTRGTVRYLRPWLTHRVVLILVGLGLLGVAAYAYWIRPIPTLPPDVVFQRPGFYQDLAKGDYREESLVDLAQYLSPAVVWVAIAGWFVTLWAIVRGGRGVYVLPAVVVVFAFSLVYLYDHGNTPDHFWWIRRFTPVVVPGFVLCAALGAGWIFTRLPRGWLPVAATVVVLLLTAFTLRADNLILTFAEDHGLYAQLEHIAEQLPADTPILAHGYKTWVPPLYVAFDRRVIAVNLNGPAGQKTWEAWVAMQAAKHQPAYLLVETDPSGQEPARVAQFVLTRTFTEPTCEPLPKKIMTEQTVIDLYKVSGESPMQFRAETG